METTENENDRNKSRKVILGILKNDRKKSLIYFGYFEIYLYLCTQIKIKSYESNHFRKGQQYDR